MTALVTLAQGHIWVASDIQRTQVDNTLSEIQNGGTGATVKETG